jgi:hypothetical protein
MLIFVMCACGFSGSHLLWVHVSFAYLFTLLTLYYVRAEYMAWLKLRTCHYDSLPRVLLLLPLASYAAHRACEQAINGSCTSSS